MELGKLNHVSAIAAAICHWPRHLSVCDKASARHFEHCFWLLTLWQ